MHLCATAGVRTLCGTLLGPAAGDSHALGPPRTTERGGPRSVHGETAFSCTLLGGRNQNTQRRGKVTLHCHATLARALVVWKTGTAARAARGRPDGTTRTYARARHRTPRLGPRLKKFSSTLATSRCFSSGAEVSTQVPRAGQGCVRLCHLRRLLAYYRRHGQPRTTRDETFATTCARAFACLPTPHSTWRRRRYRCCVRSSPTRALRARARS